MALPTKADLLTMDYRYKGAPFVRVEALAVDTLSLDYRYRGAPFVVAAAAGGFQVAWASNANSIHGVGVPA